MKVRMIGKKDFDQWFPLWESYNAFYKRTISSEQTHFTFDRFLNEKVPMDAMVAEDQGKLVGFVHYFYHMNTSTMKDVCYLQDLFTQDDLRGKGIGRALIEAVYLKAKEAGAPRVYWMTHETNEVAMKLYNKVADYSGFVMYRKAL
jgi:GNAT superfamily N-acetyltransferase